MAITGNNSSERTVAEKTRYTGLADCKVLAINPTKAELSAIGIEQESDPSYIGDDGRVRLDVWVETQNAEAIKTKMSLWLENKLLVSDNTGSEQHINRCGRTAWWKGDTCPYTWYLQEGVRKAFKGEEDLHNFLAAFLNTKYDTKNKVYDDCVIDSPEALFKGNFAELKAILNHYRENTVRLLFGVKVTDEGNVYQNIYNKFFEKTCVNPNYKKWLENAVEADYGTFNANFQNDLNWKAFIPTIGDVPIADAEVTNDVSTSDEEQF